MGIFAALDVSQDETAACVVSQDGTILAETICRDAALWDDVNVWSRSITSIRNGPPHYHAELRTLLLPQCFRACRFAKSSRKEVC